ncbi:MAG: toll/interleukin-1 receptor domain-containing protein [Bacteroidetes bacterium]|nr:toll/interleukin-1 receptor domain-containing protein [Bacteroidota bacterium]
MFDFLKRKKPAKNSQKIFISHRHKDNPIADLFVKLIKCAFIIENHDIRCTSLPPHALSVGSNIFETLKEEVKNAEIVLGLISKSVDESEYVLFELGASWGNSIPTFPLLITGAIPNDIPDHKQKSDHRVFNCDRKK